MSPLRRQFLPNCNQPKTLTTDIDHQATPISNGRRSAIEHSLSMSIWNYRKRGCHTMPKWPQIQKLKMFVTSSPHSVWNWAETSSLSYFGICLFCENIVCGSRGELNDSIKRPKGGYKVPADGRWAEPKQPQTHWLSVTLFIWQQEVDRSSLSALAAGKVTEVVFVDSGQKRLPPPTEQIYGETRQFGWRLRPKNHGAAKTGIRGSGLPQRSSCGQKTWKNNINLHFSLTFAFHFAPRCDIRIWRALIDLKW